MGLWMIQVLKVLEKYFDTLGDANSITRSKIFTVAMYSEKTSGHSLNISLNNCQKWHSMLLKPNHLLFIVNLHHLSPLSMPFSSIFISSPPFSPSSPTLTSFHFLLSSSLFLSSPLFHKPLLHPNQASLPFKAKF